MNSPQDQITAISGDISQIATDTAALANDATDLTKRANDINVRIGDIASQVAAIQAAWPAPTPTPTPTPTPNPTPTPTAVQALIADLALKQDGPIYGMPANWDPNNTPIVKYQYQPSGKTAISESGVFAWCTASQHSSNARCKVSNYRVFGFDPATGTWTKLDYSAWQPWESYCLQTNFSQISGAPRRSEPGGWSWPVAAAGQFLHYVPGAHPALAPGDGVLVVADVQVVADNPALPVTCDPMIASVGCDVRNSPTSSETPPVPAFVLGRNTFVGTARATRIYACSLTAAQITANPPPL